jgi:hypothetical protein
MRYLVAVASICVCLAAIAPAARGERPPRCSFAGEPAPTRAQSDAVVALAFDIQSLDVRGDHRPVLDRLRRFLDEPCFRGLRNVAALPEVGSARALKEWWWDGGRSWLQSAIAEETLPSSVVLPASARRTLPLDRNEQHALAPLLCRAGDADCGRETEGWMMRATEAAKGGLAYAGPTTAESVVATCNKVQRPGLAARYAAWRDCLEGQRRRHFSCSQLPVGPFRAPTIGWLVVRGRRGHYTFTDELAAFDLATGAAYRAIRPGDLGILPPEDAAAEARRRAGRAKVIVHRGRVPLDNLREAALMLMLWPERRQYVEQMEARLPAGLRVTALPRNFAFTETAIMIGSTSADTELSWDWLQGGKPIVSGKALYRGGGGGTDTYPAGLLEIAEAALQPGCPPAALPREVLGRGSPFGGVHPSDATRTELDATEAELVRALTEATAGGCDPRRP